MIEAIEKRRLELGVSRSALERAAVLGSRHYWYLLTGRLRPRPATLARLKLALARLARNPAAGSEIDNPGNGQEEERLTDLVWRFAVAWICEREGFDAATVLASDPNRRATQDREWAQAAKIRRLAIYAVNQFGGVNQADLARVTGMSKGGVSQLIKEIEEAREEPGLAGQLDELSRAITGVWW